MKTFFIRYEVAKFKGSPLRLGSRNGGNIGISNTLLKDSYQAVYGQFTIMTDICRSFRSFIHEDGSGVLVLGGIGGLLPRRTSGRHPFSSAIGVCVGSTAFSRFGLWRASGGGGAGLRVGRAGSLGLTGKAELEIEGSGLAIIHYSKESEPEREGESRAVLGERVMKFDLFPGN